MTGTLWHSWANEALLASRLLVMQEVKLDPWMPEGWSGTADWVFWSAEHGGFVLGDLKTIRGDGIPWIEKDGAKREHLWQLSSYWWALYDAGLPMVEAFAVLYWPKDRGTRSDTPVKPVVMECKPLPRAEIYRVMEERWTATKAYLDGIAQWSTPILDEVYLNEHLAPEQDRVQKLAWNTTTKVFDLKLVPHWSAAYCPFEAPFCSCSEQGVTKIGQFDTAGNYKARKGYEHVSPTEAPTVRELNKRRGS